jgi:hypothetical protein
MVTGTTSSQTALSPAFPLGSRLNERGRLEIGGCDTIELAREYGTPAYVVAEDDLRARARAFLDAGRGSGHEDFNVVFASKAFPCTAVLSLFAREGLWCDVASAGELHLALNAGYAPERIVVHGNAKSEPELRMALEAGVGLIVVDNFDKIERMEHLTTLKANDKRSAHEPTVRPQGRMRPCGRSRMRLLRLRRMRRSPRDRMRSRVPRTSSSASRPTCAATRTITSPPVRPTRSSGSP